MTIILIIIVITVIICNFTSESIPELSPELQSRWAEFASTTLENINKINNTDLVGVIIILSVNQLSDI